MTTTYAFCLMRYLTQSEARTRGGGDSWEFMVGVCRPVLQVLTLIQTKNAIFHTHFQDWRRSQNV